MSETRSCIPAKHPSLAGHFPGDPIVPGVVLLDEIIRTARNALGGPAGCLTLPWVKFHAPLRPGEEFVTRLEPLPAASFKFTLQSGEKLIASGNLKFE
jgi:3-hydroxyacyl-[acyl-carrier-protein] dehydratase